MLVINLFGGPGAGKSTTAAGLFHALKLLQTRRVELVTEAAKDLWYENKLRETRQIDLAMEQFRRLARLVGHVDIAITDSPLLLGRFYAKSEPRKVLSEFLHEAFPHRLNVMIQRSKVYEPHGRRQSEESARAVDRQIEEWFGSNTLELLWHLDYLSAVPSIVEHLRLKGDV